ncbi:alpha/beta fold hydrolase [Mesorhizobium xinjiangense]|uniref:alpha/beta fold hydrolase n=1 Tax=Mesorhizobium xinjiangense TaxID=2678685 RepID=UPI0012EE41DC|nr:alpha/beta hydrolase [Mesorhizobium xinjiangense]
MVRGYAALAVASIIGGLFALSRAQAEPVTKQMEVNGTTLRYVEEGSGDPVVFLHGAVGDLRIWDAHRPQIADQRRFIAYTQRYFGTVDWPDEGKLFSLQTHVQDLIAFVQGFNSGPVHLVTWSYGGQVGTYAALVQPNLFRSMVHFEPTFDTLLADLPGGSSANSEMLNRFGPTESALQAGKPEDAALRLVEAVFKLPDGAAAVQPEPWPTIWRENARTVLPSLKIGPGVPVSCRQLGRLKVPTLVVEGQNTYARFSMVAEQLAACLGNGLLVTMPDVNHDGPYRNPAGFAAKIESFLDLAD